MTRIKQNQGFTLIELMTTVVILSVFVAIAVPSFTTFINNNRLQSVSNELASLLLFARSNAVQNNTPHIVCLSAGTWTVKRASLCSSTNDLRSMTSPANTTITPSAGLLPITFNSNGTTAITTNPRFIICKDADTTTGYTLTVKTTGQIRIWNKGKDDAGTALTSCTP